MKCEKFSHLDLCIVIGSSIRKALVRSHGTIWTVRYAHPKCAQSFRRTNETCWRRERRLIATRPPPSLSKISSIWWVTLFLSLNSKFSRSYSLFLLGSIFLRQVVRSEDAWNLPTKSSVRIEQRLKMNQPYKESMPANTPFNPPRKKVT